jgi:hypothetical protein
MAARITDLTLQRRERTLSIEEVIGAFAKFDELGDELNFAERQYAVHLLESRSSCGLGRAKLTAR